MVVALARGGEVGSSCVMATEFPFGKIKRFWRLMAMVVQNAVEPYV
jgi:hypothetical protein